MLPKVRKVDKGSSRGGGRGRRSGGRRSGNTVAGAEGIGEGGF